jgi:hypothetical protein
MSLSVKRYISNSPKLSPINNESTLCDYFNKLTLNDNDVLKNENNNSSLDTIRNYLSFTTSDNSDESDHYLSNEISSIDYENDYDNDNDNDNNNDNNYDNDNDNDNDIKFIITKVCKLNIKEKNINDNLFTKCKKYNSYNWNGLIDYLINNEPYNNK